MLTNILMLYNNNKITVSFKTICIQIKSLCGFKVKKIYGKIQ